MEKCEALAALGALSQETRLDIFRLLMQTGPDGVPAGQIAERLGLPFATVSFHLSQLKQADLVTFRRESRSLIYTAVYPSMIALIRYLTENCCQGDAAACGVGVCDPPAVSHEERSKSYSRARR